jgi:hypothetical protein
MAKYSKERVELICNLIKGDDYTIEEICRQADIHVDTFYDWKNNKPEFSEAIKKAELSRLELFRKVARSGLLTLLQGKEFEEVTTEYVEGKPDKNGNTKPKIKLQRKVKKYILPNPTSVIFTLKNLDPENFPELTKQQMLDKNGKPTDPIKQVMIINGKEIEF